MKPTFLRIILLSLAVAVAEEHAHHGTPTKVRLSEHHDHALNPDFDHNVVVGSSRGAAEFHGLSPEESKKRLRVIALKMDVNGDGIVNATELEDWVYKSLLALDEEETRERFEEIDQDRNNKITWKEYVGEAFGTEEGGKIDNEYAKLMEEDRIYFDAADLDHDGILSEEEFMAFQNPEHYSHMHDALVRNTLSEKDSNKDGKIDLKEFLGDIFEQPESEFYVTEKARFQEEYDKNGDGYLDGSELRAWLVPDMHTVAKEEASHLIQSADKDKDGNLTIDEIVEDYSTFTGSEATNFGEQLHNVRHEEL